MSYYKANKVFMGLNEPYVGVSGYVEDDTVKIVDGMNDIYDQLRLQKIPIDDKFSMDHVDMDGELITLSGACEIEGERCQWEMPGVGFNWYPGDIIGDAITKTTDKSPFLKTARNVGIAALVIALLGGATYVGIKLHKEYVKE